nr:MAG TPA: hypothetical protein [Caudoviricetes sp.]
MFLHHFTEVYGIFAPFLPLIKQKSPQAMACGSLRRKIESPFFI